MSRPFHTLPINRHMRAFLETALTEASQYSDLQPLLRRERPDLMPRFTRYYAHLSRLPRRVRRSLQRQWKRSLAAIALLLALGQAPALAATINVAAGLAPGINDDGQCALIEAIENANDNATGSVHDDCTAGAPGAGAAGADTIVLPADSAQTLTARNNSTFGSTGLPVIASTLTIEGNGSTITRGEAAPAFRIFAINGTGDLTLKETTVSGGTAVGGFPANRGGGVISYGALTLTNSTVSGNVASFGGGLYKYTGALTLTRSTISGNSASDGGGGGVYNRFGDLTLANSIVSDNSSGGNGGGLYNHFGVLTLTSSTVSGNSANYDGGGVYNFSDGTLTVTNSTISGNNANVRGGGVINYGILTLTNSTVSGNSANVKGGGVFNFSGTVDLVHSTVSGNSAGITGGGIYNFSNAITLGRSLVSGNTASSAREIQNNFFGTVTVNNFNLLGHGGDSGLSGFSAGPTDIVPDVGLGAILDPSLGNNGGPTRTHVLIAGSPAIDAAGAGCPPPATDQRGVGRPQGTACDIGALEFKSVDLAVSETDSPDPVLVTDHLTYTLSVRNIGDVQATGVTLTDTLPSSAGFVSATPSQGSCVPPAGGAITCDLGTLERRARATVTIVVKPTAEGTLANKVEVTSETDENPANNTDTEDTIVAPLLCDGLVPTIVGTPANDTITGTNRRDVIHGLSGNDALAGLNGNDVICGGRGRDALDGGDGTDTCDGGSGTDTGDNCETVTSIP